MSGTSAFGLPSFTMFRRPSRRRAGATTLEGRSAAGPTLLPPPLGVPRECPSRDRAAPETRRPVESMIVLPYARHRRVASRTHPSGTTTDAVAAASPRGSLTAVRGHRRRVHRPCVESMPTGELRLDDVMNPGRRTLRSPSSSEVLMIDATVRRHSARSNTHAHE